jgi:hypothetical protein
VRRGDPKDAVASIQARLVQRSHDLEVEHQLTLARFGCERLLYRLSRSAYADRFVLKGAALLLLWLNETTRPTKDIDLLGLGDTSADALKLIFVDLCQVVAPEDGLTFLPETVRVEAIREGQEYGGMRVTLMARLGNSRIPLQVDIGSGMPWCHRRTWSSIPACSTFREHICASTDPRRRLLRRRRRWFACPWQTPG